MDTTTQLPNLSQFLFLINAAEKKQKLQMNHEMNDSIIERERRVNTYCIS